jgi:hypothetical protein
MKFQIFRGPMLLFSIIIMISQNAYCDESLLAKDILLETGKFQVADGVIENLESFVGTIENIEANNNWKIHDIVKNALLLSATEIAILKSVNKDGGIKFPVYIRPEDLIIAYIKYDTIDGGGCFDPGRIIKKHVLPSDIFLFAGDYSKMFQSQSFPNYHELFNSFQNYSTFNNIQKSYIEWRSKPQRPEIITKLHNTGILKIENFLMFLKTSISYQKKPETIKEEAKQLVKKLP